MNMQQAEVYLEMMRYQDVEWRNVHIGGIVSFINEQERKIRSLEDENEHLRAELNYGSAKAASKVA